MAVLSEGGETAVPKVGGKHDTRSTRKPSNLLIKQVKSVGDLDLVAREHTRNLCFQR